MDYTISVTDLQSESIVDGVGVRAVLYVAGCHFQCKNCHNPQTWDISNGTVVSIQEIYDKIIGFKIITGITYSGGEPMLQAKALTALSKMIKAQTNYDIWCFTGYLYEDITSSQDDKLELLQQIDVLVDGRYIDELKFKQPTAYRGSKNQRMIDVRESVKQNKIIELPTCLKCGQHIEISAINHHYFKDRKDYENLCWDCERMKYLETLRAEGRIKNNFKK